MDKKIIFYNFKENMNYNKNLYKYLLYNFYF